MWLGRIKLCYNLLRANVIIYLPVSKQCIRKYIDLLQFNPIFLYTDIYFYRTMLWIYKSFKIKVFLLHFTTMRTFFKLHNYRTFINQIIQINNWCISFMTKKYVKFHIKGLFHNHLICKISKFVKQFTSKQSVKPEIAPVLSWNFIKCIN